MGQTKPAFGCTGLLMPKPDVARCPHPKALDFPSYLGQLSFGSLSGRSTNYAADALAQDASAPPANGFEDRCGLVEFGTGPEEPLTQRSFHRLGRLADRLSEHSYSKAITHRSRNGGLNYAMRAPERTKTRTFVRPRCGRTASRRCQGHDPSLRIAPISPLANAHRGSKRSQITWAATAA
jgi:hypothetical protein